MTKQIFSFCLAFITLVASAQIRQNFPQDALNQVTQKALSSYPKPQPTAGKTMSAGGSQSVQNVLGRIEEIRNGALNKLQNPQWITLGDTIIVGATPNDTLFITGNWTHYGPILVMGNGVLIFYKATVVDTGDIYVFQDGKLLCDSSSLTFPQQYFYQRSLIAVQNATVQIAHTNFNYSGMSHNLVLGDSAQVWLYKIHQNDWTTCGLFSKPTLVIDSCNLAGEYILMDSCTAYFNHTDTLLLWHHFPMGASVNYAFPNGASVNGYYFGPTTPGVSGIKYQVGADTCSTVWWALMPENGTNVNISNSVLRAIGTWFRYNDTANVQGLFDNSSYTNFTAPLSDRNLQLVNTDVQTWSLYVFDKSHIDVANCQVGEVGTQQRATVTQTNPFLLDGSGGYYWCTDTSAVISFGATVYSYTRSEKNGIFIFAYGWEPFSAPQAIGKSLMVYVQSTSPLDPVPYDGATVYMDKIDGPDTSYTNITVPVIGSAWIDWAGSTNSWMDFSKYSLFYRLQGNTNWTNIVKDSMLELHHAPLANWNTWALAPGNYDIKLTVYNTWGDSVEAIKPMTLLLGAVAVEDHVTSALGVFPNPANDVVTISTNEFQHTTCQLYDITGKKIGEKQLAGEKTAIDISSLAAGMYYIRILRDGAVLTTCKVVKQ